MPNRPGEERALALMAGFTTGGSFFLAMARDTACHGGYVSGLGDHFHLRHIAMAHFTGDAPLKMRSMAPIDKAGHRINRFPGNWHFFLRELSQLLNRGLVDGHARVTSHAGFCSRYRHSIAWLRIGVAEGTGKAKAHVRLVAEWQWLHDRGHIGLSRRGLLKCRRGEKCRREEQHGLCHPH